MVGDAIGLDDLFDRRLTFPDDGARRRLEMLVGVDDVKARTTKLLAIMVNPAAVRDWACRYHPNSKLLTNYVERRPPLVVFGGEVGTGKTELAETIGDAVARMEKIAVTLLPMSLKTRGTGRVGEMTSLLTAAFDATLDEAKQYVREEAKATGGVILLVDEADSLTQSRASGHMHHEDRAGVNAFIRGVDRLAEQRLPAVVILCTNRLTSIDPAVQRRAADIVEFNRPNARQRRAVIEAPLIEVGITSDQIDELVRLTGSVDNDGAAFTYSDLTQRLLPNLLLDAYPDRPITYDRALVVLEATAATPTFSGDNGSMQLKPQPV